MRHLTLPLACLILAGASLAQPTPTWTQIQTTTAPAARWEHAMAYDSVFGRTLLFGGRPATATYFNDTWEYDGKNWTQLNPQTVPGGRWLTQIAYDTKRLQAIMFGGLDASGRLGDTWAWDSVKRDWIKLLPKTNPPARYDGAMAWDSAREVIVMFGGYGPSTHLNDTWEWNGTDWTQIQTTNAPAARYTNIAYDAARKRVVLYGGSVADYATWEYDGKTWTQVQTKNRPAARCCVAMEYDAQLQRVVAFGGFDAGSQNTRETWVFDGTDWKQLQPTVSPPARRDFDNLVYDTSRRRLVLFGGFGPLGDTWEFLATPALTGDPGQISIATGGAHKFALDAGSAHAGRLYWIFGSVTGISPGVTLPSPAGPVTIPLNPDPWTDITIGLANSALLSNTRGALDSAGQAQAALNVPRISDPAAIGVKLYHAYLVYDAAGNYYLASNAVTLELLR